MDNTPRKSILGQLLERVSRVDWSSDQFESACPSKKGQPRKRCTEPKSKKIEEEEAAVGPPCIEKWSYVLPSQICPKTTSCCYIKMQDPYQSCCCEPEKPQLPPCPPKCGRRQPREPTCGCDLCKKHRDHKCCDNPSGALRSATNDSRYFRRI